MFHILQVTHGRHLDAHIPDHLHQHAAFGYLNFPVIDLYFNHYLAFSLSDYYRIFRTHLPAAITLYT